MTITHAGRRYRPGPAVPYRELTPGSLFLMGGRVCVRGPDPGEMRGTERPIRRLVRLMHHTPVVMLEDVTDAG